MRVLFWSGNFWPQIGGAEVVAAKLLPAHSRIFGMPTFIKETPGYSDQVIAALKKVISRYDRLLWLEKSAKSVSPGQ